MRKIGVITLLFLFSLALCSLSQAEQKHGVSGIRIAQASSGESYGSQNVNNGTDVHPQNGSYVLLNPTYIYMKLEGLGIIIHNSVHVFLDGENLTHLSMIHDDHITISPVEPLFVGVHAVKVVGQRDFGGGFIREMNFRVPAVVGYSPSTISRVMIWANTTAPLSNGTNVVVTLAGPPNGEACFDVGDQKGIKMVETSPGTYVGEYTVNSNQIGNTNQVMLTGHLKTLSGEDYTTRVPLTNGYSPTQAPSQSPPNTTPNNTLGY